MSKRLNNSQNTPHGSLPDPVDRKRQAPGRRERKAKETRLRLFQAALQLFADRGFQSVTVEDITEAADVGKGTFFNYFESKDHVLGVMVELQLEHVVDAVQAVRSEKGSVRSILHRMFLQLSEELGRSPEFARTVVASFLANAVVRGVLQQRMSEGRAAIAQVIAEGQARGEIDTRLSREEIALQVQRAILGTAMVWSLYEKPQLAACIEGSFRLLWRGIAARGREQKARAQK